MTESDHRVAGSLSESPCRRNKSTRSCVVNLRRRYGIYPRLPMNCSMLSFIPDCHHQKISHLRTVLPHPATPTIISYLQTLPEAYQTYVFRASTEVYPERSSIRGMLRSAKTTCLCLRYGSRVLHDSLQMGRWETTTCESFRACPLKLDGRW